MSPRTKLQNEKLRVQSEEKILNVALELFSRFGYAQTSIRMIAKEADISLGLLYNYFESKEVLLLTLIMQALGEVKGKLITSSSANTPKESLYEFIQRFSEMIKAKKLVWKLFYSLRMQPEMIRVMGDEEGSTQEFFLSHLEEVMKRMGYADAKTEARILLATLDGVFQHYVLHPESYPLDEVMEGVRRKY